MSAPIKGNRTTANPTPGSNVYNFSHNHNTGSDGYIFLVVGQSNTQSVSSVTYGGVPLVQIQTLNLSTISTRYTAFKLQSPATGLNTMSITFSSTVWNPIVYMCYSFTNCGDIVSKINNGLANSPHSASPTILQDSMLYCSGISSYTINSITIDGVSTGAPSFNHDGSVNGKRFTGHVSAALSSGSRTGTIDTGSPTFQTSNHMIEIQGVVSTNTDGDFFMMW